MRLVVGVVTLLAAASLAACAADSSSEENVSSTQQALTLDLPRVPATLAAGDVANMPGDLRSVPVPGITDADLAPYVKDKAAAIRLGKALFWDMQVGSDGIVACASCHFRAGADPRSKNQMNPGHDGVFSKGTNYQLTDADFPLTKLATPGVRGALGAGDTDDVVSSMGVHHLTLGELDPNGFTKDGVNTRRVEPRNTPSVINAVYNHRQFWDGRADATFNGVNHFGARDTGARVLRADDRKSDPVEVQVAIKNASLASQAVTPLLSTFEMAKPGRNMLQVGAALTKHARGQGKKICDGRTRPLGKQVVSRDDSVLGDLALAPARGLKVSSYDAMVADAFNDAWWNSKTIIRVNDDDGSYSFKTPGRPADGYTDYTLTQYNWALIFGIAVQLYEETLVSDNTPWDQFRRETPSTDVEAYLNPRKNTNPNHITSQQLWGATLFNDRTRGPTNIRCSNCHENAEMTDASARRVNTFGAVKNRDGNVIDRGFNNLGIRPTDNDLGVGGTDVFGELSFSKRQFTGPSPFIVGTTVFDSAVISKGFGVQGGFKIPSLRNVALTAPYFHNGEARSLHQAVEFYSRGGNVAPITQTDLAGGGTGIIEPVGVPSMTDDEIDAIVAFLESLTDERVLNRKAPFDHPQLFVSNGHPNHSIDRNHDGLADDIMVEISAVGRNGGTPTPGFLEPGPFSAP